MGNSLLPSCDGIHRKTPEAGEKALAPRLLKPGKGPERGPQQGESIMKRIVTVLAAFLFAASLVVPALAQDEGATEQPAPAAEQAAPSQPSQEMKGEAPSGEEQAAPEAEKTEQQPAAGEAEGGSEQPSSDQGSNE
jgi:hypothetical protein